MGTVDMHFYKGNETIDEWVERIGRIGAMKLHPREFYPLEIIQELLTCDLSEMTEDMARVIVENFNKTSYGRKEGAIERIIKTAYEKVQK